MSDLSKFYPLINAKGKPLSRYSVTEFVDQFFSEETPEYQTPTDEGITVTPDMIEKWHDDEDEPVAEATANANPSEPQDKSGDQVTQESQDTSSAETAQAAPEPATPDAPADNDNTPTPQE